MILYGFMIIIIIIVLLSLKVKSVTLVEGDLKAPF